MDENEKDHTGKVEDPARWSRRSVLQTGAMVGGSLLISAGRARGLAARVWSEDATAKPGMLESRCEGLTEPLGLQAERPRLSWRPLGAPRGPQQSAYQVLVSSRPGDNADLWDSGRVGSSAVAVDYAGEPLDAHQEAFWRVRTWTTGSAEPAESATARWAAGPRTDSDWGGAVWIGRDDLLESTQDQMPGVPGLPKEPNWFPSPYLRKEFQARGPVQLALLYACGLGYGELHVNGQKLGADTERDPGFTNFDDRVLYVTHDVTPHLGAGANVVGAVLGTGWFDTHDVATWHFNTAPWRERPRILLALVLRYADGTQGFVVSDGSWRCSDGPIRRDGVYTGEVYDARRELPGWNKAGFDDLKWTPALLVRAPRGKLVPLSCQPVRTTDTITPVKITEPQPGVFIVNMGQNFSGHTQLRVKGPAGQTVTMRYAELLNPDGTLNSKPIDHFMEPTRPRQPFQQDTYICKGSDEMEVWEQRFSWSGFQYVEVTGFPGTPTVENFRGRFAHTDTPSAGEFSCSDEVANQIQHATRWSFLSNAQSYPTDCPQREKNGWTGDAGQAVEAGLMNFESAAFYAKWLEDFADAQRPDGGVPVLVPNGGWGDGERWPGPVCPPWDAAYPIITREVYRANGDRRILERHLPALQRYLAYFLSFRGADGLAPALGIGDWSPWKTVTPQDYITNAYLYLDLKLLERICGALGKTESAGQYAATAREVGAATHRRFYDPATHRYSNGSQMAQGTALYFGFVPDAERAAVLADLVQQIETLGHLDVGFLGAKFVLRSLAEGGHVDLAYRVATQPEMPSYGYWMKMGATTLWEGWKAGPSYNHIMFGDISAWFYNWIAGLQQEAGSIGWERIVFRPNPVANITTAKASYMTPRGPVAIEWTSRGKELRLQLQVPQGASAGLELPAGGAVVDRRGRAVQARPLGPGVTEVTAQLA